MYYNYNNFMKYEGFAILLWIMYMGVLYYSVYYSTLKATSS